MATLKITGVDDVTVEFVVERSKALHFKGQAEYLRNLIREDMARASSDRRKRLGELLGPLHAHAEKSGITEEKLSDVIERVRNEVAESKRFSKDTSKMSKK